MCLVYLLHDLQDLLCIFTTLMKSEVFISVLLKMQVFWDIILCWQVFLCGLPGPEDEVGTIRRAVRNVRASSCRSLSVPKVMVMMCWDVTICTTVLEEPAASVLSKQVSHLRKP